MSLLVSAQLALDGRLAAGWVEIEGPRLTGAAAAPPAPAGAAAGVAGMSVLHGS